MDTNLQSLIRMLLAAIGAFFIGHAVLGTPITQPLIDTGIGVVVEVVSLVWGIRSKTATVEAVESAVRNLISFAGGFLVAKGSISADQLTLIIGAATSIATYVFSWLSKKKAQSLASNKITAANLVQPGK